MNGILEQVAPNKAILGPNDVNVERIVVPVDLLEHSKKTALYAIALSKGFGASITFVHVFPGESITGTATVSGEDREPAIADGLIVQEAAELLRRMRLEIAYRLLSLWSKTRAISSRNGALT
jgi:nucleotide-binding universal stress UspA family protein